MAVSEMYNFQEFLPDIFRGNFVLRNDVCTVSMRGNYVEHEAPFEPALKSIKFISTQRR